MEQKTKMKRKTILKGYSLVELILTLLIIGVIAAIAIPSISSFVTESKIKATKREMMEIVRGMIGDPESGFYGYTDNLGDLPDELPGGPGLDALFRIGTASPYNPFTKRGWNGPYCGTRQIDTDNDGTPDDYDLKYDVWGNAYVYDKGNATITSNGPPSGGNIVVEIE